MMPSISSLTPPGTAAARSALAAGAGNPMASAFAMIFALMPGMGDTAGADGGEGQPKSDGDTAKDGSTTEKDGKDLPSDATALPVMPFAAPTPSLAPPEPAATPVAASGASPAPITTLLAAIPMLPDAGLAPATAPVGLKASTVSDQTKTPVAAPATSPTPIATLLGAMPILPDVGLAPTAAPAGRTASAVADPTKTPVAFDPLKGTMPVPPAIMVSTIDDANTGQPITIRPDAPLATTSLNTGSSAPIATRSAIVATPPASSAKTTIQPDTAVAPMPSNTASATTARDMPAAIVWNTAPNVQAKAQADTPTEAIARGTVSGAPISPDIEARPAMPDQAVRIATPGIPLAIRADAVPTTTSVEAAPIVLTSDRMRPARTQPDMPLRFTATGASAPIVAPLPIEAPAPVLQAGQTASALQLFGMSMRGEQGGDSRADRRKDEGAPSVDPATLTRADSLIAAPGMATAGAEQAPLDMTQPHWPQGMIDRIDRMREDAATADTRIQLSPDALGGIAVNLRHEGGATHIHFTADQAQTASMLADAQPTLARLAEEKGMRLGQTGVDLGQSGTGGERQASPRRPDPVVPSRPAFTGATTSSDAAEPAAASTRIA